MESDEIQALKREIAAQKEEIEKLKQCLQENKKLPEVFTGHSISIPSAQPLESLDKKSIERYSRQLILPEFGVHGQLLLQHTSVLVVGCGGLGCPAALYLTAAGIGRIGLVDHDEVELSNLHRQILHTEARVNVKKSASAAYACSQLNSSVVFVPYCLALDSTNALSIIKDYDLVLDATDNVATRYLLNDACVLSNKPLISGSALRFEGQLTVYNYDGGPCYRCLFPKPPPSETVTNCSEGGVLGVVPGIIGTLQALEVIKIATRLGKPYSQRLLLYDAVDGSFKTIKLRTKKESCEVCGSSPIVTKLIDYEQFCGTRATDKDKVVSVLKEEERISALDYKTIREKKQHHLLIDVRQPVELEICHLPGAMNVPIASLNKEETILELKKKLGSGINTVFVICHHGNDSQEAVKILKEKLNDMSLSIKDIKGGFNAWAKHVDQSFPIY